MELIIKIPDYAIKTGIIENDVITYFECCSLKLFKTFKSAVVLPKNHGRLIDADDVNNHIIGTVNLSGCPTIIERSTGE